MKPTFFWVREELERLLIEGGLRVIGERVVRLNNLDVIAMYSDKVREPFWNEMVEYLTSADSLVLFVQGKDAIKTVLRIKGKYGVGGLRDKYNVSKVHNVMHSPENKEENKVGLRVLRG